MATVFIPSLLEGLTGGARTVEVSGRNLRQVINALDERYPGMKERLLDEDGALIPEIMAAIDGETNHLGLLQPVTETTEIQFVPAIGGG
ncbi:MAG: MoaD/ThiS family protein [Dehalococcoidia bacterium]|nr:MoaD/ThiS family protein [Chloroflexota bacterium]MXX19411.1 MoaD/ThiS family protein [Dehalococcoidia bacterium]MCY3646617.1 MoaD/ThiS family protein [Chloroflexota bacterium]MDE2668429.1 MoaD/ThiS family protein [Chloroflexota bacterium]MXY35743.1 MoaD/ThiS family protein [Dehalococcoidia bacterium]